MSIQFKDLRIRKKTISFTNERYAVTLVLYHHKASRRIFFNILTNNIHRDAGRVYVNNNNITDLLRIDTNKNTSIIKFRLTSIKLYFLKNSIFWQFVFNPTFLQESVFEYYSNSYRKTVSRYVKREYGMGALFQELDGMIRVFTQNFHGLEDKWSEQFRTELEEQCRKYLLENVSSEANANLMLEYLKKKMNLAINRSRIIFLQSLWDQVSSLNELRYNCRCYKEAKSQKLDVSLFIYEEIKIICDKYLKTISWEIFKCRFNNYNNKKLLKKYLAYFRMHKLRFQDDTMTLKSIIKSKRKVNGELNTFLKAEQAQYDRLLARTQRSITTLMPDEMTSLAGRIGTIVHSYHRRLLNVAPTVGGIFRKSSDWKVFNFFAFFNIINANFQQQLKKHQIDINKFTKSNFYDNLKIRLLIAFILNKELVIFDNVLSHLNNCQIIELVAIINRLRQERDSFNVVFINRYKSWLKALDIGENLTLD